MFCLKSSYFSFYVWPHKYSATSTCERIPKARGWMMFQRKALRSHFTTPPYEEYELLLLKPPQFAEHILLRLQNGES